MTFINLTSFSEPHVNVTHNNTEKQF